ncbi:MAG: outer membrane beta-barrel protein [Verrucomicrobiota bacterium]
MKKLIQTASLLSAGAAVFSLSPVLAAEGQGKPWGVSLGLRGFYDDNIFTGNNKDPQNPREYDAFGFEVTPGVRLVMPLEQSSLKVGYNYGFRWFDDRPGRDYDQFHLADVTFAHNFNTRHSVDVYDSFALAQEPEQVAPVSMIPGTASQFLRSQGDNLRNTAGLDFSSQWAPRFSTVVGYRNNLFDYDFAPFAAVLNRMEHLPQLNLRYHLTPATLAGVGYQYGITDYSDADYRDQRSHYVFGSLDHSFSSQLVTALRAGAQIIDWYNAPLVTGVRDDAVSPYVDFNTTYAYTAGSNAQLGVRYARNATDVDVIATPQSVYDQLSILVYGSVNHAITAKLKGSLIAMYQSSEFIGVSTASQLDGANEDFVSVGLSLSYAFTRYLSGEASYFYDHLGSAIDFRTFNRNRVFLGVRMTY